MLEPHFVCDHHRGGVVSAAHIHATGSIGEHHRRVCLRIQRGSVESCECVQERSPFHTKNTLLVEAERYVGAHDGLVGGHQHGPVGLRRFGHKLSSALTVNVELVLGLTDALPPLELSKSGEAVQSQETVPLPEITSVPN